MPVPSEKVRRAARTLLFRSGLKPGVKGWELRKVVGNDYLEVVKALDERLTDLGLRVVAVGGDGDEVPIDPEREDELRKCTFLILMRGPVSVQEASTAGWRIDDLAMLSVALLYLISRGGRAGHRELLSLLRSRFRQPRVDYVLNRLIKMGYLEEEGNQILIGWRSRIEIDLKRLSGLEAPVEGG